MLTLTAFVEKIKGINSFKSKTGKACYVECQVKEVIFYFSRKNTGKAWKIKLTEAYSAYVNEEVINTVVLRNYMSNRVYSPTLGLLIAIKLYNVKGLRN